MMKEKKKVKPMNIKIEKIENALLILGLLLAPLTSLRVWKIGPGELFLFVWSLLVLLRRKKIVFNLLTKFWYLFLLLLSVGTFFGNLLITERGIEISQPLTYLFFTLFITSLVVFFDSNNISYSILKKVYWADFFFFSFLFFYGTFIAPSLLGLKLWFASVRFTGGALNPHQFAYTSGPMIIIGLYLASVIRSIPKKIVLYLSIIPFIMMSIATRSATLEAVFLIEFIMLVLLSISDSKLPEKRTKKRIFVFSFIIIFVLIFSQELYSQFLSFVQSDPNGPGRFELWRESVNTWKISPIFGLGFFGSAGAETGITSEAHNTYFELLLNSGLLGLSLYLFFIYKLSKFTVKNKYALLMILFFVLYGFGGYSFRRVYMWYITISAYYLVLPTSEISKSNDQLKAN